MIVNSGIRRFLVSTIQRLFNSASVELPLTHSAIPTRGSITPSFTRATTETGQKWDDNGYLDFTALAGEIVFKGARRERNLLSNTGWLGGTSGTLGSGGVAPTGWAALGGTGSLTFADSALHSGSKSIRFQATAQRPYIQLSVAVAANSVYMAQATVEAAATSNLLSNLLAIATQPAGATTVFIKNGTIVDGATTSASAGDSIAISMTTAATAGTSDFRFGLGAAGSPTGDVTLVAPMIANITGETDQTTIRPYVSVGVESAPAYHGSMVDGVKCFDTDRLGNPIATTGSYPIVGYVPWEARTNIALQSQNYAVTWTTTDYTITSTNNTAPDGTATASLMTEGSAGTATISQPVTATANANYSYYRYIKRSNNDWWQLAVYNGGNVVRAWFNLATGVKGSTSVSGTATVVSTAMTPAVNGWYRCEINVNIGSGATAIIFQGNSAAADASTARVNSAAAYMWGNQFNDSASFAAPYVPTTTVAVARNADVLTYTGADVANIKTLACTFSRGVGIATPGIIATLNDGTASNRSLVYLNSDTQVVFLGVVGAASQWTQAASNSYTPAATSKVSYSMETNNILMSKDGVAQLADTSATVPVVTTLSVGCNWNGATQLNGPVNHIYGWTRNLSQSELGAIDR